MTDGKAPPGGGIGHGSDTTDGGGQDSATDDLSTHDRAYVLCVGALAIRWDVRSDSSVVEAGLNMVLP